MKLVLINSVDKKKYEFSVTDAEDSGMFYHFTDIQLPSGIDDGQYDYSLYDDEDELVATGIVQIGTFVEEQAEYTGSTSQTYIQYQG